MTRRQCQTEGPGRSRARALSARVHVEPLHVLQRGDRRTLYRAVTQDQAPVIVEVLVTPRPADVERLHHEYELTRDLSSTAALRALVPTTLDGSPALVFEDFAGVPLSI